MVYMRDVVVNLGRSTLCICTRGTNDERGKVAIDDLFSAFQLCKMFMLISLYTFSAWSYHSHTSMCYRWHHRPLAHDLKELLDRDEVCICSVG
jgi:hypothetical protein